MRFRERKTNFQIVNVKWTKQTAMQCSGIERLSQPIIQPGQDPS
jgi:hypothetical protein